MKRCSTLGCGKAFNMNSQRSSFLLHASVCGAVINGRKYIPSDNSEKDEESVTDVSQDENPTNEPSVNESVNSESEEEASYPLEVCRQDVLPQDKVQKKKKTESVSTKRNWCQFCETFQTKIARHLKNKHKDLPQVQVYLNTTDDDKVQQMRKRREISKLLLNLSNYEYNKKIQKNEMHGSLLPARKSKVEPSASSHVICSICQGLFSKKNFANHKVNCMTRQKLVYSIGPTLPSSRILCSPLHEKFKTLQEKVLDNMNKDEITLTVMQDTLILEYGRRFLKGHMADHQRNYVASKMRTLASLLLRMQHTDSAIQNLQDCLDPTNFNTLCEVVKAWSNLDEKNGVCGTGSVPRRICKSIKVCSHILLSEAIKSKSITLDEQREIRIKHEQFTSLMESDWSAEVSCAAEKSLKVKKVLGAGGKMPLEEDIVRFFKELTEIIEKSTAELQNDETERNYNKLTKATLTYLIAFNCRRPVEVSYATISNYKTLKTNVSREEKVTDKLAVFMVTAFKNDKQVPVIVPGITKLALDVLLDCRAAMKIPGNLLLSKKDGTAYNGSAVLSNFSTKMQLKKPQDFTANGLRHYWATISQTNPELKKHMPKFLGHTMQTHQKFYEMPLDDIQLNLIGPAIHEHCYNSSVVNKSIIHAKQTDQLKPRPRTKKKTCQTFNIHSEEISKRQLRPRTTAKTKVRSDFIEVDGMSESSLNSLDDTSEDPDYTEEPATPKRKKLNKNHSDSSSDESLGITSPFPAQKRLPWISPEKKELFEELPSTILGLKPAKRGQIRDVWERSKIIKNRHSLQMTRIEVSKYFTKKKKVLTPQKTNLMKLIKDPN